MSLQKDRLNLNWSRRWTYKQISSILTSQWPITQNITWSVKPVDLEVGESEDWWIWPTCTSYWSSRSWIPNTERIHKPRNTSTHKVKHEALSQFNIEAGMLLNEPTNRSVRFHCFEDKFTNISVQSCGLRDKLTNISVRSHRLEDELTNRSI
jgi:hypothetical protein